MFLISSCTYFLYLSFFSTFFLLLYLCNAFFLYSQFVLFLYSSLIFFRYLFTAMFYFQFSMFSVFRCLLNLFRSSASSFLCFVDCIIFPAFLACINLLDSIIDHKFLALCQCFISSCATLYRTNDPRVLISVLHLFMSSHAHVSLPYFMNDWTIVLYNLKYNSEHYF
jgi:hypothetical protein